MKRKQLAVLGLLLAAMCRGRSVMAAGESLVPNGTFDTDVSGWTTPDNTPGVWSPDDADGATDSGSAVIGTPPFITSGSSLRSDCISVVGGSDYFLGAAATWTADSDHTRIRIGVSWWGGGGCGDPNTPLASETISVTPVDWATFTQPVSAPADASSASVYLNVRIDSEGPLEAHVDNIVLAPVVCGERCGDPVTNVAQHSAVASFLAIDATDVLYLLGGALGEQACPACICDVNDDGRVSATDALLALDAALGEPVTLTCPQ